MAVTKSHDVRAVARNFRLLGELRSAAPYGTGHINDTYAAVFDQGGAPVRYILQRINPNVFKNPLGLMENVARVTAHLARKLDGAEDFTRRALTLIPALDGGPYWVDPDGSYWRAYVFVEKARTYDALTSPTQAYEAARAFGEFQSLLADLPAPRLHETIPGFHHTPQRFARLEKAIERDALNRAATARREIDFALARKDTVEVLVKAGVPERVTHNDTKINNVMLDDATGKGICVIDLDTVMPGLVLYDFGDMVRTSTSPAAEDELDLSKVQVRMPMFEALVRGYLSAAGAFLTRAERDHLVWAGKIITFTIAIRFLTDYLEGDTYFKVHRDGHNLDRTRTQFRLMECIEQSEDAMNAVVLRS